MLLLNERMKGNYKESLIMQICNSIAKRKKKKINQEMFAIINVIPLNTVKKVECGKGNVRDIANYLGKKIEIKIK